MSQDSSSNDPYRPPSMKAEEAMSRPAKLAKWERKALETYLKHRDEPIHLGRLTLQVIPSLILVTAIIGGPPLAMTLLLGNGELTGTILKTSVGFLFGYGLCIFSINRRFVQFWPVLRECLDWQKIEEKLTVLPLQTAAPISTPIAVQVIEPSEPKSQTLDP